MIKNYPQQIILDYLKNPNQSLDQVQRSVLRGQKMARNFSKSELLKSYHELLRARKIKPTAPLEKLLIKRAIRTLSGVAVITVLTEPWPCPGQCVYCPDEARMPKSYLSDEPAAARALSLRFDPYEQVARRIESLRANGHPTDKIELIVKGGSWNAYPIDYQYWFIGQCFAAANGARRTKRQTKFLTLKKSLDGAQIKNESAKHRIVGLTLETRPDLITAVTIDHMRALGCTRIEMGVQSTDDRILDLIERGHDSAETKSATRRLKDYGFKVDYHLMPQLPGSTPAKDKKMLAEIFSDPDYRPDMIKIYPCTVIKGTKLYRWLRSGRYRPYSDKKLIQLLIDFKTSVPRYVRISRLIRDIPSHHIYGGNNVTNLRQVIKKEMDARGLTCQCLRCREAGHAPGDRSPLKFFCEKYASAGGTEYFLTHENKSRTVVYAFCRLRVLDANADAPTSYRAFIRELHTYGQMTPLLTRGEVQHTGLGKDLLARAEQICKKQKLPSIAVISGVGVRPYYRRFGYRLVSGPLDRGGTYMVKKLSD